MKSLEERLAAIGLEQYVAALQREGFETWHEVMDITESDLELLGIKIGHRRRLQRAIQDDRRGSGQEPLPGSLAAATDRSTSQNILVASAVTNSPNNTSDSAQASAVSTTPAKRKYRRHPKPDENAPSKPPSAYVIFASKIREQIKHQGLNFSEVAKLVGERWQGPDASERAACEEQARQMRIEYTTKLGDYKKTREYSNYQKYLNDFKARQGVSGSKSSRLSFEVPTSAMGGDVDSHAESDTDVDGTVADDPPATRSSSSTTAQSFPGPNKGLSHSVYHTAPLTSFRPSRPEDRPASSSRHSPHAASNTYDASKADGYGRMHSGRPWEITPGEMKRPGSFGNDSISHDRDGHDRSYSTGEESPSKESFSSHNTLTASNLTASPSDMSNRTLPMPTGLRILPRPNETPVHDQHARMAPMRYGHPQGPPGSNS